MTDPIETRSRKPEKGGRFDPGARSAARLGAVQALYQMDIAHTGVETIVGEYEAHRLGREIDGEHYKKADKAFFRELVAGVVREQRPIDRLIDSVLADGWPLFRIDSILRAILRAGTYELKYCPRTPPRVVINEYLDIAAAFFDGDEKRVTNGVLDRVARETRAGDPTLTTTPDKRPAKA